MSSKDQKSSVIMGVDPGTRITGYGILRIDSPSFFHPLDFGCIRPPIDLPLPKRYLVIFNAISKLIAAFSPSAVALESQFVSKNVQSTLKLGMAKGAVILAAAQQDIPVYEYAPKKAKLAVVGTGTASKFQVQKMVQMLLQLENLPTPEDTADALALAICHAHENNSCLKGNKNYV